MQWFAATGGIRSVSTWRAGSSSSSRSSSSSSSSSGCPPVVFFCLLSWVAPTNACAIPATAAASLASPHCLTQLLTLLLPLALLCSSSRHGWPAIKVLLLLLLLLLVTAIAAGGPWSRTRRRLPLPLTTAAAAASRLPAC
jgi:hypothetical protein